ncbi:hypothetical protein [uncultured Marinobacter sp.]|uniref:hypothetical protein n=1 Tax=uncultured Marinobacter sp. TaxID=187379 RepID=UPI0030DA67D3
MTLTAIDLEIPRTHPELRAFIEEVRANVRATKEEFARGMNKQGYYKEFLDEVEPLCNFAEVVYPADYKVQPVLGNQGYDAIVHDNQGNEFEKIELAKPYDGAAAAANTRQVLTRGHSDIAICDWTEILNEFFPFFEATVKKKSLKDYSGITVVFILAAPPALPGLEEVFERKVERLKEIIANHNFNARRVFLYIPSGRVHQIQG